tara:strand:- start:47 stop:541 length:495 start_codon:yes stop_codon:yes gene_type:complete
MGVGFFGKLFSKVSPTIKSVKPTTDISGSVKRTKRDEFRKRYTALDKAENKIKSGKKMMQEGQKERTKMVDTNRAFQFKGGSYHAIEPGKNPKKEYKGLLKEKKAKGGRVGLKLGTKRKSNVEKIKKTFGTLSVRAGIDNNPNPTYADKIAGAKMKNKKKKKFV